MSPHKGNLLLLDHFTSTFRVIPARSCRWRTGRPAVRKKGPGGGFSLNRHNFDASTTGEPDSSSSSSSSPCHHTIHRHAIARFSPFATSFFGMFKCVVRRCFDEDMMCDWKLKAAEGTPVVARHLRQLAESDSVENWRGFQVQVRRF